MAAKASFSTLVNDLPGSDRAAEASTILKELK